MFNIIRNKTGLGDHVVYSTSLHTTLLLFIDVRNLFKTFPSLRNLASKFLANVKVPAYRLLHMSLSMFDPTWDIF